MNSTMGVLPSIRRGPQAAMALALVARVLIAQSPPEIARWLPAEVLFHAELRGGPAMAHAKDLALAKILAEPEVQALFGRWLRGAGAERAGGGAAEDAGDALWSRLVRGFATVSFLGMADDDRRSGARPIPDFLLTLTPHAEDATEDLFPILVALLPGPAQRDPAPLLLGGEPWRLLDAGGMRLYCGQLGRTIVVGTRPATIEALMERRRGAGTPALATAPSFERARARIVDDRTLAWLWMAYEPFLDFVLKQTDVAEQSRDALALSGLSGLEALGYSLSLDGAGFRDRIFALVSRREGWFSLVPPADALLRAPSFIPADAGLCMAGAMTLEHAHDATLDLLDRSYPKLGQDYRSFASRLQTATGVGIRDDLVSALGPEYGIYAAWPRQAVIPDLVAFVAVRDTTVFTPRLLRISEALVGDGSAQAFDYEGHRLTVLDLDRMMARPPRAFGFRLRPTFALVGDYLVVTPFPQALKNLVHGRRSGAKRLADREDFAGGLRRLGIASGTVPPGLSSFVYADVPALFGFLVDQSTPAVQSLGLPVPPTVFDPARIPRSEVVTRHLFGLVGFTRVEQDAMVTELHSPTSAMPMFLAMSALASAFVGFAGVESEPTSLPPSPPSPGQLTIETVARAKGEPEVVLVRKQIRALRASMSLFRLHEGRLPADGEWPHFILEGSPGRKAPYCDPALFDGDKVVDPWGRAFVYERLGERGYRIASLGRDGKPGGQGEDQDIELIVLR